MSTAVGSYRQQQVPIRKSVPQFSNSPLPQVRSSIVPDHANPQTHSRTRTTSSSVFPPPARSATAGSAVSPTQTSPPAVHPAQPYRARRTLSNATSSTSSSSQTHNMQTSALYRASSTASTGTTTSISYVAQMRRQKATVWCERSQFEDPRLLAQQRAAKARANMEVVGTKRVGGGSIDDRNARPGNRTSTASGTMGGVRSRIRHHPKATLSPANMAGTGVPMRLSASEVDEPGAPYGGHHRSGSGRSSLGSGRRVSGLTGTYHQSVGGPRYSTSNHSSTPSSVADVAEETPVPDEHGRPPRSSADYLAKTHGRDTGSISSGERENSFGQLGTMHEMLKEEREMADDLRRRGSVDERTTTMTGPVRLFVANPDLSD